MSKPETANYETPVDDDEDVYTVAEFMEHVKARSFMDCDGFGVPAKDGMKSFMNIEGWLYPSECPDAIPADATHVCWYNK